MQLKRYAICSLAATALACGSDGSASSSSPTSAPHDAADDAYTALEAANYGALPEIIDRLDAAFTANPDSGRFAFYSGVMRLWRATGGQGDPLGALEDLKTAVDRLESASKLSPKDPHVFGFLGISDVVLGNILQNQTQMDQGRTILTDAVPLFPPYINGIRALAFGQLSQTHAFFPDATDAVYATLTACGYSDVQTQTAFAYPGKGASGSCSDDGIVAHVYEGFFLTAGDIFVKNGDPEKAQAFFANARNSPTYGTWLLKPELEDRITNASDRAAKYADADTSNDPLTWMQETRLCVGCHARSSAVAGVDGGL